jgi:hypothetical protein
MFEPPTLTFAARSAIYRSRTGRKAPRVGKEQDDDEDLATLVTILTMAAFARRSGYIRVAKRSKAPVSKTDIRGFESRPGCHLRLDKIRKIPAPRDNEVTKMTRTVARERITTNTAGASRAAVAVAVRRAVTRNIRITPGQTTIG